jgi:hypothetical protein
MGIEARVYLPAVFLEAVLVPASIGLDSMIYNYYNKNFLVWLGLTLQLKQELRFIS